MKCVFYIIEVEYLRIILFNETLYIYKIIYNKLFKRQKLVMYQSLYKKISIHFISKKLNISFYTSFYSKIVIIFIYINIDPSNTGVSIEEPQCLHHVELGTILTPVT